MAEYTVLFNATNELGGDSQTVEWVITTSAKAYSNVVGENFDTLGAPKLNLPDEFRTIEGSSGNIDLAAYNEGGEAVRWRSLGEMPEGAELDPDTGMVYYTNVASETMGGLLSKKGGRRGKK